MSKTRTRFHNRRLRNLGVRISRVALLALLLGFNTAAAETTDSYDLPTASVPPQRPTKVTVAAYLIGLSRVSEPSAAFPTFEVEMYIDASWKDPRLAFSSDIVDAQVFQEEEAEEKLSEIWSPDLEIENEVEQRQTESVELRILRDGTVEYEERFGATLNAELDLARFPFDAQTLEIEIQSFLWDQGDSVFVSDDKQTGFDSDFETPEWIVTDALGVIGVRSEIRDDRAFSAYTFRIHAQRKAGHYVLRFIVPLMFVMLLTWCALLMPVSQRYRVGFIALLTVVASHTVISGQLPRLHYPTFADVLLLECYVFATALIVTSIWVQRLEESEEDGLQQRARKIDKWTRWSLPLIAALVLVGTVLILWY